MPVTALKPEAPFQTLTLDRIDALCTEACKHGEPLYANYLITHELAEELLQKLKEERHRGNRRLRRRNVTRWTQDMLNDRWALNGETIKFNEDGVLVDGQNRLYACLDGETSFVTGCAFGVPTAFFDQMDVGAPRNAADLFSFSLVPNANQAAATVRWIMRIRTDPMDRSAPPAKAILDYYLGDLEGRKNKKVQDTIKECRRLPNSIYPLGMISAFVYCISEVDEAKAKEFLGRMIKEQYEHPTAKVIGAQMQARSGRMPEAVRLGLYIDTWNILREPGKRLALGTLNKPTKIEGYVRGDLGDWR